MSFAYDWSSTVRAARLLRKGGSRPSARRSGPDRAPRAGPIERTGSPRTRESSAPAPVGPPVRRGRGRLGPAADCSAQASVRRPSGSSLLPRASCPLGKTRIEVDVTGAQPGDEMDFFVDGRKVGKRRETPLAGRLAGGRDGSNPRDHGRVAPRRPGDRDGAPADARSGVHLLGQRPRRRHRADRDGRKRPLRHGIESERLHGLRRRPDRRRSKHSTRPIRRWRRF